MTWLALGASAALQILAGVVRVRAWFHVIRHSWPGPTNLRYRDVVLAHLGGAGWNAVLPARAGDAVKIVIVNGRMPERRPALLASTLVPPALIEAAFTALLVAGVLATSIVTLEALTSALPPAGTALVVAGAVCVVMAAVLICRRHLKQLLRSVHAGLTVLGRPRVIATKVVPWLVAGRVLRLVAFAMILPAAGLPLDLSLALALMALQGATPSAGATATAARIALLAAVLARTGAADVPPAQVAAALAAAYAATSAANLAASAAVIAWLLRTASPPRIIDYARSALRGVKREPGRLTGRLTPADGTTGLPAHTLETVRALEPQQP